MYFPITIHGKHRTFTYAADDFGEFGSVFAPDSDFEIPTPLNSAENADLEQKANADGTTSVQPTHH